ncbi:hypothetical protein CO675_32155 [Bradyrhizobium sp. C9]|nr:hypothetical protein CO675_32155 [Bradyrhizobium sp. C9]
MGSDQLEAAHFEYPTRVWGGGFSMTDIMAFIPNAVVAVEAKVDEPFDELVSNWIFKEEQNNSDSPPHRTAVIQRYASALRLESVQLLNIRYQLLQRTLAVAITAKEQSLSKAWMIVQSFSPTITQSKSTNRDDFDRFVELVGAAPTIENVQVRLAWASDLLS